MSASSTQFTCWLMIAVCSDDQRLVRVPPRPEAVGEPEEVDLVDGAQHLGDRTLDDLVLQSRHAERALPAIGFRDVDAPHRLRPVAPGVDPRAEVLEVGLQVLLVVRHRDPIDSRTGLPLLSPERSFERLDVDMMQQGGEPGLDGRVGPPRSPVRGWLARLTRLCVRTLRLLALGSFRAGPFPRRVSFPSTASSVL